MSIPRIVIIGLDGASPALIRRWEAELPNLSRLMREGVHGVLWSSIPPNSLPAWYCFATGKNPGKLGVYGFRYREPGTYRFSTPNFSHCPAKSFWELANEAGYKAGIFNMPGTFPPPRVDGFLVSSMPAPPNNGRLIFTHPPELSRELDKLVGGYEIQSHITPTPDNEAVMLREHERVLRKQVQALFYLMETQPWHILVAVLVHTDRVSHHFWKHMDPTHPRHEPEKAKKYRDVIKSFYQASDQVIGQLLQRVGEDTTVFVMSDHGFGPLDRRFLINNWLIERGYLHLLPEKHRFRSRWRRLVGRASAPIFWLNRRSRRARRLLAPLKRGRLAEQLRQDYITTRHFVSLNYAPVDWSRTRAYAFASELLAINLQGREPNGIVPPGTEYEELRQRIVEQLRQIVDPRTGTQIPVEVHYWEELYTGENRESAPDIIFSMDHGRCLPVGMLGPDGLFDEHPGWSANHRPDGILVAWGKHIRTGGQVEANLVDLAPTVLHLLGLPIPEDADGRVITELFDPSSPPARAPVHLGPPAVREREQYEWDRQELEQVEERLRALGYLD